MAIIRFACPPGYRDQAVACLAASDEFFPHPAGKAAAAGARMAIIADIDACSSPPRRRNTSQRPGPLIIGGAVPQTAAIPVVTRHCTPGQLNFATHSPQDSQTTRQKIPFCRWWTVSPPTKIAV
jgi:hypothetical protein